MIELVKILQVKIYNKDQQDFLDIQSNVSDFIRDLIDDVRKGNLVKQDHNDIKTKLDKARLDRIKKLNLRTDIQNRIDLVTKLKYSPSNAISITKGEKTLDDSDELLRCPTCNWHLDYLPVDVTVQVSHMIDHLKKDHQRMPTQEEQEIFMELVR